MICMKGMLASFTAALLLLVLIMPQLAGASSGNFISLSPSSGRCGDLIEATAIVASAGVYRVCWLSPPPANVTPSPANLIGTFIAPAAGNHTIRFRVPETTRGLYTVCLTTEAYSRLANATFEVFPSVKIDPAKGPVGTTITVKGHGFAAAQDVRVNFLDTVKTATATTVGSWSLSHTIPPTPAGAHLFNVEVREGAAWVFWMSTSFSVTPKITATPTSGKVGHTIEVKGTGFAKNERDIQISFGVETIATNILADENGSWSTVVTVPPSRSGAHIIDASGSLTRARDVPDIKFTVSPGILVEPSLAYVGDTITVSGGGFAAGERLIEVTFAGRVVASVPAAGTDGSWKTSFVLPPSPHGANPVSARGYITAAVTATVTTKARIESLNPSEGAPGDTVTVTGTGFHRNQRLTVTVGGAVAPGELYSQFNGNVDISFRVPKGVTRGRQTLTVTDEGGATGSVTFTVKEKVLSAPAPMLPKDGSRVRAGNITFRWGGITSDNNITYSVQIVNEAGNVVWSTSGIRQQECQVAGDVLPPATYYWQVRAEDDFGNQSQWSSRSSFTVWEVPTWVWVMVGVVVLVVLMVLAYRETKFRVTE